jgi:hypothetical protein
MIVIKIDNNPETFLQIMTFFKKEHPDLAFISYIGGEIGFKVILYNSIIYNFSRFQRGQNKFIIGLCFIGNTFFLKHYCDIILEVQDIAFTYNKEELCDEITDLSYFPIRDPADSSPYFPANKPYAGSNYLHPFYKNGYFNRRYEEILLELNLSNIFFTYHCASHWQTTGDLNSLHTSSEMWDINLGKINNQYYRIVPKEKLMEIKEICKDNNLNHSLIRVASFIKFNKNNDKANTNIAVWIRNTTNDTSRNLPESIYSTLFDFCIQTKRHLHIFLDWQKVPVPESEYLHVYDNLRVNNSFLFDEFVKICNKSYLFIGCDSGTSWIAANYTKANCLIFSSQWAYGQITNPQPIFHNKEQFLDLINKIYHISIV